MRFQEQFLFANRRKFFVRTVRRKQNCATVEADTSAFHIGGLTKKLLEFIASNFLHKRAHQVIEDLGEAQILTTKTEGPSKYSEPVPSSSTEERLVGKDRRFTSHQTLDDSRTQPKLRRRFGSRREVIRKKRNRADTKHFHLIRIDCFKNDS